MTDRYLLEDGSGVYLLEDGSSAYLLEAGAVLALSGMQPLMRGTHNGRGGMQQVQDGIFQFGQHEASAAAFVCDAVTFDGTDWLTRGSDLTSSSDNSQGTFSCWLKFDAGGDGSAQYILTNSDSEFTIFKDGSGLIDVFCFNTAGTKGVEFTSSSITSSSGWVHVLASWDINFSAGNKKKWLYVNDAADISVVGDSGAAGGVVDYTSTDWQIGASPFGFSTLFADVAEMWFAPTYLDLSTTSNRRKFIDGSGKPVDLGADGSTPTGSQPLVYLHLDDGGTASDFGTNIGSGGGFTTTGALTTASTSPSD